MIVIVTKNGNQYVNDKAVISVNHNREMGTATIVGLGDTPPRQVINSVEQIIYISNSEKVTIKENGNGLHDLEKKYDNLAAYNDRLRNMVLILMNEYPATYDIINEKVSKKLEDGDGSKG